MKFLLQNVLVFSFCLYKKLTKYAYFISAYVAAGHLSSFPV